MYALPESGDGPSALQVLQHLHAAAPALRLVRPEHVALVASRPSLPQQARGLLALLAMMAAVAAGQPGMAGVGLCVDRDWPAGADALGSLSPVLEAFGQPQHAISTLHLSSLTCLGPADRLGVLLRTALPSVKRLMLNLGGAQPGQLQAVAWGLPKLAHVCITDMSAVHGEVLETFACALSWQRQGSGGSGGGSPCVRVEV